MASKILYRDRKKQIIDFSGLQYGAVIPTDLDAYFEKNDKLFIFYEFKHLDAPIKEAQLRAHKRLVNAIAETGRKATLLICRHNTDECEDDVDAASAIVDRYYYDRNWYPGNDRTAREITNKFYNHFIGEGK